MTKPWRRSEVGRKRFAAHLNTASGEGPIMGRARHRAQPYSIVRDVALWTLYPSRRLLSARVTAFLDHLKESFPQGTPEELAAYF
jgi:hypothetical protein